MPKKRELTAPERAQILLLHKQGLSQVKIAKELKCSRCAVQTTIRRFRETKSIESKKRSGRKHATTPRQDRIIIRNALKNRRKTSSNLSAEFNDAYSINVSARTVRRRLLDNGLKGCKARKKPFISEVNRKKRLHWAKNHKNWTCEQWSKVIWSDESNYQVSKLEL